MAAQDETLTLRDGAVSWREVGGETILLDLEHSDYLGVNASGTLLWRLLSEGTTRSALVDALTAGFDIDADTASSDVDAFVATARERNLLA